MPELRLSSPVDNLRFMQVTIASGASVSEIISTQGSALVGIYTDPAGWTAAAIGFRTCWSGNNTDLVTAYDSSQGYEQAKVSTDAAAAGVFIATPQSDTMFVPFLQVTSRTAGADTAVNQAAARTLTLVFRRYLS